MAATIALSIAEQVRAAVAGYFDREADELDLATHLVDGLGADPLERIDLALTLEARFGVAIDDATIEAWETVGDVVRTLAPATEAPDVAAA